MTGLHDEKFTRTLGLFVSAFARMETTIRHLLQSESGMTEKRLEALVGTPTIAPCADILKRLALMSDMPDQEKRALDAAITHLGNIRAIRDRLVHCGGVAIGMDELIINPPWKERKTAPSSDRIFKFHEIEGAIEDMHTMRAKLMLIFNWRNLSDPALDDAKTQALTPWRYTRNGQAQKSQRPKGSRASR